MILGGDELGRTQQGNNNASCQDNPISWFDWTHADLEFLDWCRALVELRRHHPVFRRRRWFQHHAIRRTAEIIWLRPDGKAMSDDDWATGYARAIGVLLDGEAISTPDRFGGRVVDDTFYVVINASELDLLWTLPSKRRRASRRGDPWAVALDTSLANAPGTPVASDATLTVIHRSIVVLRSARSGRTR
jgi:glycogen operon protein